MAGDAATPQESEASSRRIRSSCAARLAAVRRSRCALAARLTAMVELATAARGARSHASWRSGAVRGERNLIDAAPVGLSRRELARASRCCTCSSTRPGPIAARARARHERSARLKQSCREQGRSGRPEDNWCRSTSYGSGATHGDDRATRGEARDVSEAIAALTRTGRAAAGPELGRERSTAVSTSSAHGATLRSGSKAALGVCHWSAVENCAEQSRAARRRIHRVPVRIRRSRPAGMITRLACRNGRTGGGRDTLRPMDGRSNAWRASHGPVADASSG